MMLSDEAHCLDCHISVHAKCRMDAPEQCGPLPEPTLLAHFRRLLLDGRAKHRIFRPKVRGMVENVAQG